MRRGKATKWAKVWSEKTPDDPQCPRLGEFKFSWNAILFRPGSTKHQAAFVTGYGRYQSKGIAFRNGVRCIEGMGYKLLSDDGEERA